MSRRARGSPGLALLGLMLASAALVVGMVPTVGAQQGYQRISGEGSSWAAVAIDSMRVNVKQYGITVDYASTGSSAGRKNWLNGTVDFAASDIPFQFQPEDGSAPEAPKAGSYAYIPVTAGGTAFMYNLKINGQRVTNLRLSGENVARIFTGKITRWDDPALLADNPGLALPARKVVPVVRSDGSGSSAQFTTWLVKQHNGLWLDYCGRSGRAPKCGFTSYYPTISGSGTIAQSGDLGVSQYVAQGYAEGAIGYVNYSYAINAGFPVAKVLNAAGYYTAPTPENVSVSLLKARVNQNKGDLAVYLTQELDGVYTDTDSRNYPLSSYSYFILPTQVRGKFNEAKGRALGAFAYYAMCQAQQQSASLGYSPIPINLVQASFEQIRLIPGVEVQSINIGDCKNPTFSPDGTNLLAANAPRPQECDRKGPTQCADGTGGARRQPTAVSPGARGGRGTGGGTSPGGSQGGGSPGGGPGSDRSLGGGEEGSGSAEDGAQGAACDPDTGCASSDSSGSSASSSSDGPAGATPLLLAAPVGWSSSQTLSLLVGMLVLALIVVPALAWVRLAAAPSEGS